MQKDIKAAITVQVWKRKKVSQEYFENACNILSSSGFLMDDWKLEKQLGVGHSN